MGLRAMAAEDFQFARDDFAHRNGRRTLLRQQQPDLNVLAAFAQITDGVETGKEMSAEPLDTWFDVALFPETKEALEGITPLFIKKHRLRSGKQNLAVLITTKPGIVAIHPQHKTDQAARVRKSTLNVRTFFRQRHPANFHKADIIGVCVETQLPQPSGIQWLGGFAVLAFADAL